MKSHPNREETISALVQLRSQQDAARLIADQLGVKDMGPADHIRTKHEIKAFIESTGTQSDAETLATRALARRTQHETHNAALKMTERPGQGIRQ